MLESLGRQIPICTDSLRCQLHPGVLVIHNLTEPEVQYFDLTLVKDDVGGFQVVVDDLGLQAEKIVQS